MTAPSLPSADTPRVAVVGGGLGGLACAFELARGGAEVVVLEALERAGGVVGTLERDGFRFERGPNTVQASSPEFRRLCADLGISERLIVSSPAARERSLWIRGRLERLPTSPAALLSARILSPRARLSIATEALRRWRAPPPGAPEPDLRTFLRERLGSEAERVLAGSFVRGVYASETSALGARSAFPRLWKACEEHGSLVRGLLATLREPAATLPGPAAPRSALLSFPGGLQEIVDALSRSLGPKLRTRAPLAGLEPNSGRWRLRTEGHEGLEHGGLEVDRLVLAVPAHTAAAILGPVAPRGFPIEHLRRVDHASVTLVHLGFERGELTRTPRGFGYLVPPAAEGASPEVQRVLGTIFTSNLFPGRAPEGCVAVSSFYSNDEIGGLDERELTALAREDLGRAIGEPNVPRARVSEVVRHEAAIPRYAPGHRERMEALEHAARELLPSLHFAGNYVAGVSVEQVIARGRSVAAEILG